MLVTACASPPPFSEMQRYEAMPDAEIVAALRLTEHQPRYMVAGLGAGITENGWGMGGHAIRMNVSTSRLIESQLVRSDRLIDNPKMLQPLLRSNDREAVLAAMAAYDGFLTRQRNDQSTRQIYREAGIQGREEPSYIALDSLYWLEQDLVGLMASKDLRIKCFAVQLLIGQRWLSPQALDTALSDNSFEVKGTAIMGTAYAMRFDAMPGEDRGGLSSTAFTLKQHEAYIEVLLKHLDDDHRLQSAYVWLALSQALEQDLIKDVVNQERRADLGIPSYETAERLGYRQLQAEAEDVRQWWAEHRDEEMRRIRGDVQSAALGTRQTRVTQP